MASDLYSTTYLSSSIENQLPDREGIDKPTDPLQLNIPDKELVEIVDDRIRDSRLFYKEKFDLYERRKKNEVMYFGRQIAELDKAGRLRDYEEKNVDNLLYEIESNVKPLAMSQLPDLIVTPGNQSDDSKESAELLSQVIDTQTKSRNNRIVLGLAFKHRPIYFWGVIKIIWNPELAGGLGDYQFINVHPDTIDFDQTVTEPDADKMRFVSQLVPLNVQEVIMRFPDAEEELWKQLAKDGLAPKEEGKRYKALATPIDIYEVWFHEYKKDKDDKWQRIEGVMWKYKKVVLKKMKNPDYDYEGETQVFTYDTPGVESTKRALSTEEMQQSMLTGVYPPNVSKQQVYHNYFRMPRKPFFFMTYDQWGKQPLDETSTFEQNIRNQEILDKRLKNINEKLNTRGHHIWSKLSGLKPADIEKMDHNNPDEDYYVDDEVSRVHKFIEPEQPTQQEFADLKNIRERMHEMAGDNAVHGNVQTETATTNQIAREANYTRADDLVDETINPASEWMAVWSLQFIKLRYTQEHFRWLLGKKGELLYTRLHQNLVEDGMEVMIKASGVDKLKAHNNAMEMAKMQLTDPLSFFQDMGLSDPEGRTAKLLMFNADPKVYLAAFIKESKNVTQDLIKKLESMTPPAPGGLSAPPGMPPGAPAGGPLQQPSPANTAQMAVQPPMTPPPGTGAPML